MHKPLIKLDDGVDEISLTREAVGDINEKFAFFCSLNEKLLDEVQYLREQIHSLKSVQYRRFLG